jgi:hypothetical protein
MKSAAAWLSLQQMMLALLRDQPCQPMADKTWSKAKNGLRTTCLKSRPVKERLISALFYFSPHGFS